MTDKEKKALREAFDFPEPDRKEEFLAEFARLSVNNNKKRLSPVVMRFAAAAAMIAIIIGVFAFMPKDTVDFGHDKDEIITVTETTSVPTSSAVTAATTAVTTAKAVRTDKTTSAKTTSTAVTTAKQAATAKTVTAQRTETSQRNTAVRTTAVHTTVRTTSAAEKTEATQKPVTTTTASKSEDIVPPYGGNNDSGRDMTVSVDMTYPLREKTLTEDQIYPKDSGFENQGPISSKPVDTSALLESMYNDSSAVVLANTDEMLYTSIDGFAVTAENLTIVSSYKGDLRENDRITVFFSGGYVPAEKYLENHRDVFIPAPEEYSVYEKGSSRFPQKKGEQYIFFIKNDESIKNGAYSPVRSGNTAVFRKIQDNYVSVDDGTLYFTEAQLDELK